MERYVADQIAVALPHLRIVQAKLEELGVRVDPADKDDDLSLALLKFSPEQASVAADALKNQINNDDPNWALRTELGLQAERQGRVSEVDWILTGLRRLFALQYKGFEPTVGKLRVVERVAGQPHVRGGGEGAPEPPKGSFKPFPERVPLPGQGVRVAVLDTKLVAHPWLQGAYVASPSEVVVPKEQSIWRFGTDTPTYESYLLGHCTFVSGLILQAAPSAIVEVHPVLDENGDGSSWELAKTLMRLAKTEVQVACLACATTTADGRPSLVLERAIQRLGDRLIVVAAAGNHGDAKPDPNNDMAPVPTSPMYPAALTDVIAVGAVDENLDDAPFNPPVPWIKVTAPGVGVVSTYLNGRVTSSGRTRKYEGYAIWEGTSMATAIVAGTIAARIRPGASTDPEVVNSMLRLTVRRDNAGRPYLPGPDPYGQ